LGSFGQLESLREHLAAVRRASAYATATKKSALLFGNYALEQQITALEAPQQRATDLASQSSDTDHKEAEIYNLGLIYETLGQVRRAEELYREALVLADESKNPLTLVLP